MRGLAVKRKLTENRKYRGELERDLAKARTQLQKLLVDARKVMPLKDAAAAAGIDYRHAKRLTAGRRDG